MHNMQNKKRILMTGGGTLGPVTPLLALEDAWREEGAEVMWITTKGGPENLLLEERGETWRELHAPKLSRHKWWAWPAIPFLFLAATLRARRYLLELKPDIMYSAGAYVSVPVALAAKLLGIPVWIHQLDAEPGLANRLMAPLAARISTTFPISARRFPSAKTTVLGGLSRFQKEAPQGQRAKKEMPLLLVMGGGTGAKSINDAMELLIPELAKRMHIVHLAGRGKVSEKLKALSEEYASYEVHEFLGNELLDIMQQADLIVSRAGMGTILGLIYLKKASIIIPIEHSHQEKNAAILDDAHAAIVLEHMTPQLLKQQIDELIVSERKRAFLEERIQNILDFHAAEQIIRDSKLILGEVS
jgi:UDP-N-acetylglucosamine--N-acetylmuramyl-(pentapeptide) pyrophosphoryl-undecaprenol N-acetylglucosamine transferase